MKKFNFSSFLLCEKLFKFDLKMRLTTLLLIVSIFQIQATDTYSQNTKISLKLDDVTIEDVFKNIETQSEFTFLFNHKKIDVNRKVSIDFTKERISSILETLFSDTNIYFKVRKKQIILKSGRSKKTIQKTEVQEIPQEIIEGIITDSNNVPIPGVNILIVGTNQGTQTDFDGKYSIQANDADVLRFTFIGYKSVDVTVGSQANYSFSMLESVSELDEVVVVGYGTEIKRNLTSSVASISADELQDIPATSLSNAIAGRLTGVNVSIAGGRPGTTSDINVRGATTGGFSGSSAPLYVIDNIIATKEIFDLLDVNEVDQVSVLKDAAATAVYGSRASNGVILVTTKRGKKGKPTLSFTTSIGSADITRDVRHTTAYEHSLLINKAIRAGETDPSIPNSLQFNASLPENGRITATELEYFRTENFPNFLNLVEVTPVTTRYAASVSGATDIVDYFVSGSYIDESGSLRVLNYDKANVRANVGVNISDNLRLTLNTDIANDNDYQYFWPHDGNNNNLFDGYRQAGRRGNWGPAHIDGLPVSNFNAFHIADYIDQNGIGDRSRKTNNSNYTVTLDYKIPFVKGLSAGVTYNSRRLINTNTTFRKPHTSYTFAVEDPTVNRFKLSNVITGTRTRREGGSNGHSIFKQSVSTTSYQLNFRLNYDRTFGDHNIKGFFNYEQWEREDDNFWVRRRNPLSNDIRQLFATSPNVEDRNGNGFEAEQGRLSYIGSLGYSYKNKYFLNGTFRVDGSVEFVEDKRYGFFPSISGAWILSEEDFFGDGLGFINFAKLRGSYGRTGNDDLNPNSDLASYLYLQGFGLSGTEIFGNGNGSSNSLASGGIPNVDLTWNKTDTYNIAADFEMFNNRLSSTIEVFKNHRFDLFGSRLSTVPVLIGTGLPPENYGVVDVKGVDFSVNYKNKIGDLSYDVGVNIGYSKNKIVTIDESDALRDYQLQTGRETNRIFGYKSLGIIRTQTKLDELLASGYRFNNQLPYIGSLYFEDIRGNAVDDPQGNTPDGVIDGNDRDVIGNGRAPINYGITLGLTYKNFSVNAFIQGFEGHERVVPDNGRFYFDVATEGGWAHWNDSFDPIDNPNGKFPRFTRWGTNGNPNFQQSSFWTEDAGFARLKNLNIAYQIPEDVLGKIGVKQAKIFFNGSNLFFIYSKIKAYDPEISRGSGIPPNKTYSLGLQVTL